MAQEEVTETTVAKPVLVKDGERLSGLSTDELFQEIADQGCLIANLSDCCPEPNIWQCNLRKRRYDDKGEYVETYYEFGRAPTYRQAIMVALHNMYYYEQSKGKADQTYRRNVNRDFR